MPSSPPGGTPYSAAEPRAFNHIPTHVLLSSPTLPCHIPLAPVFGGEGRGEGASRTHVATYVPSRTHGFTLAELIVATTILSIAMSAVYALLYSSIAAWRQVDQGFNAPQQARLALTYLQRDLQSASPRAEHLFEGDDESITIFMVSQPMDVEESLGARLMRIRYRYKPGQDELIREEAMVETALPNRPPEGQKVDPARIELSDREEFTIARNISDFELRYVWAPMPEWQDAKSPPPPADLIFASRNKEGWGLPTGIEVKLTIQHPETEAEQTFTQLLYLPMPRERRPIKMINDMLGSAAE